jgi:hypothetical protein
MSKRIPIRGIRELSFTATIAGLTVSRKVPTDPENFRELVHPRKIPIRSF